MSKIIRPAKVSFSKGAVEATPSVNTDENKAFYAMRNVITKHFEGDLQADELAKQLDIIVEANTELTKEELNQTYINAYSGVYEGSDLKFDYSDISLDELITSSNLNAIDVVDSLNNPIIDSDGEVKTIEAEATDDNQRVVKSSDVVADSIDKASKSSKDDLVSISGNSQDGDHLLKGILSGSPVINHQILTDELVTPKSPVAGSVDLVILDEVLKKQMSVLLKDLRKAKTKDDKEKILSKISMQMQNLSAEDLQRVKDNFIGEFNSDAELSDMFDNIFALIVGNANKESISIEEDDLKAKGKAEPQKNNNLGNGQDSSDPLSTKSPNPNSRAQNIGIEPNQQTGSNSDGASFNISLDGLGEGIKEGAAVGKSVVRGVGRGLAKGSELSGKMLSNIASATGAGAGALTDALKSGIGLNKDKRNSRTSANAIKHIGVGRENIENTCKLIQEKSKHINERLLRMGCDKSDLSRCSQKVVDCLNSNPDTREDISELTGHIEQLKGQVALTEALADKIDPSSVNKNMADAFKKDVDAITKSLKVASKSASNLPKADLTVDKNNPDQDIVSNKTNKEELTKMQELSKKMAIIIAKILAAFGIGSSKSSSQASSPKLG